MKRFLFLFILLLLTSSLFGKKFIENEPVTNDSKGWVNLLPDKAVSLSNDWIVQIDDYAISKTDYDASVKEAFKTYCAQYDNLPENQKMTVPVPDEKEFRKLYVEELIKQNIITLQALSDPEFTNKIGSATVLMMLRQALVQLYVQSRMPEQSYFLPTKDEIDQYYKQNQEQFDKTGASATQIKDYITQVLARQKLQTWQNEFYVKIKEVYRVKRNSAYPENFLPVSNNVTNAGLSSGDSNK
jgi:hypothetical protein